MVRKRQKVSVGDVFAIPLSDGRWALGQVVEEWMPRIICVALFDRVVPKPAAVDFTNLGSVIALPSVAMAEVANGYWTKVGNTSVQADRGFAPHAEFESQRFVGATWSSGKIVEDFLSAYHGIGSWEPYPATPGRLRSMLLSSAGKLAKNRH